MRVAKLGDLVSITGGGTPDRAKTAYWNGSIPWVTVKDFKSHVLSGAQERISKEGLDASAANLIPAGCIVLPTRMALGKAAINCVPVAINQDLKALRIRDESVVLRDYLFRFLLSKAAYFESQGKGATVKGITLNVLRDLEIPLPDLDRQQRIAAILDKADSLRRMRQEAIRLSDEYLRAVFIYMFGDPISNSKGWKVKPFTELGSLDRGISKHRPRNDASLLGGPYPLIQTGDVANCDGYVRTHASTYSEKGLAQSKLWPAGTLCITIAANIAKTGILTFPACFPDSVVGFSASEPPIAEYARFWLSFLQKTLEANAPESAQKNINLAILRGLQVPSPPLELIRRFAAAVNAIEAIRKFQSQSLKEVELLSRSLQHQLFD